MLDQDFYKPKDLRRSAFPSTRRHAPARKPSTSGYMVAAAAAAFALFFLLWWMLQSEDTPWVPAGLAASVVMLVAASARGALLRRSFRQRVLAQGKHGRHQEENIGTAKRRNFRSMSVQSESLRALQKRAAQVEAGDSAPEEHLAVYRLCADYLASAEDALVSAALPSETRLGLIAGQERVRVIQKRHMLAWARGAARSLTREAQQRVRLHEKVETANRALDCIDSALKVYPDAHELDQSAGAVREFITSSRVAHWVELAERAAFKGYYRRAIDCYRDALFYLTRDPLDQNREAAAEQITREIDLLRARFDTQNAEGRIVDATVKTKPRRKKKV